jgi:succinate dehydrogenase / fumarate reductase membrane anchor subunit
MDMAVEMSERGSSHSGLTEWIIQRMTAIYMLLFIVYVFIRFTILPISSHADWQSLSSEVFFRIALLLFIFSVLAHAWLGIKSVMLDYIHPWYLRFSLLMLFAVLLMAMVIWSLMVIL